MYGEREVFIMKKYVSALLILSALVIKYLGIVMTFFYPILYCCRAYDIGTLTATMVGCTFILICIGFHITKGLSRIVFEFGRVLGGISD